MNAFCLFFFLFWDNFPDNIGWDSFHYSDINLIETSWGQKWNLWATAAGLHNQTVG